eukprot:4383439-Amphidinium_carterae.1
MTSQLAWHLLVFLIVRNVSAVQEAPCPDPVIHLHSLLVNTTDKEILAPWQKCVFIANDHGQVLEEWLAVAHGYLSEGSKLTVWHVDAHSDLNVPSTDRLPQNARESWRDDASVRAGLANSADLANFQLMAVWAGLVDQIFWVQHGAHKP